MRSVFLLALLLSNPISADYRRYMAREDQEDWMQNLPTQILGWQQFIGNEPKEHPIYDMMIAEGYDLTPKRLPRIAWMQMIRNHALDHYGHSPAKKYISDEWEVSPIMARVNPPGMSTNLRDMLASYTGLPGGFLFPSFTGPESDVAEGWEERICDIMNGLGFGVRCPSGYSDWEADDTLTKFALDYDEKQIKRAGVSVSNEWRSLTKSIMDGMKNLLADDDAKLVAIMKEAFYSESAPSVRVVQAFRTFTGELGFTVEPGDSVMEYRYDGTLTIETDLSFTTNYFSIYDMSVEWSENFNGPEESPVVYSCPVMTGTPGVSTDPTNIAAVAKSTTLDGLPVFAIEAEDIVCANSIGGYNYSVQYESSWVDDIEFFPCTKPLPLGNCEVHIVFGDQTARWMFEPRFCAYLLLGSDLLRWDPGQWDNVMESGCSAAGFEMADTSWPAVVYQLMMDRMPAEATVSRDNIPQMSINPGTVDISWEDVGVVHYWMRDESNPSEAGAYIGYRVNGRAYENGCVEREKGEDVTYWDEDKQEWVTEEGEWSNITGSQLLGYATCTIDIHIGRGACGDYDYGLWTARSKMIATGTLQNLGRE